MKRFQIVILTIMLASLSACATNSLPSSSTESSVSISVSNPQDFLSELEDMETGQILEELKISDGGFWLFSGFRKNFWKKPPDCGFFFGSLFTKDASFLLDRCCGFQFPLIQVFDLIAAYRRAFESDTDKIRQDGFKVHPVFLVQSKEKFRQHQEHHKGLSHTADWVCQVLVCAAR